MLMPMRIKKSRTSLFSFFAAILMLSSLFASAIAPLTANAAIKFSDLNRSAQYKAWQYARYIEACYQGNDQVETNKDKVAAGQLFYTSFGKDAPIVYTSASGVEKELKYYSDHEDRHWIPCGAEDGELSKKALASWGITGLELVCQMGYVRNTSESGVSCSGTAGTKYDFKSWGGINDVGTRTSAFRTALKTLTGIDLANPKPELQYLRHRDTLATVCLVDLSNPNTTDTGEYRYELKFVEDNGTKRDPGKYGGVVKRSDYLFYKVDYREDGSAGQTPITSLNTCQYALDEANKFYPDYEKSILGENAKTKCEQAGYTNVPGGSFPGKSDLSACIDGATHPVPPKANEDVCSETGNWKDSTYQGATVSRATEREACNWGQGNPSSLENTDSADASEEEEDVTSCAITGVGWMICPIVNFLAGLADKAYTFLAESFLSVSPEMLKMDSSNATFVAWQRFLLFGNILFVIAFIAIIYSQLTSVGISNYGVKKMLPRLIIGAVLINLSFIICQAAVDISNILGYALKSLLANAAGTGTALDVGVSATGDGWQGIAGTVLAAGGAAAVGVGAAGGITLALVALLGMLLAAVVSLIMIFFILVLREVLIVLLIVLAPLAFAAYLLPNTEQWFTKWRKTFTSLLLVFPVIGIVYGASSLASSVVTDLYSNTDDMLGQIVGAGILVLPLFVVPGLLKKSVDAVGSLGGKLSAMGSKLGGGARSGVGNSKFAKYQQGLSADKKARVAAGTYRKSLKNPLNWSANARSRINRGLNSGKMSGAFNAISGGYGAERDLAAQSQNRKDMQEAMAMFGGDDDLASLWAQTGGSKKAPEYEALKTAAKGTGKTAEAAQGRLAQFDKMVSAGHASKQTSHLAAAQYLSESGKGNATQVAQAIENAKANGASQTDIGSAQQAAIAAYRKSGRGDAVAELSDSTGTKSGMTHEEGWAQVSPSAVHREGIDAGQVTDATTGETTSSYDRHLRGSEENTRQALAGMDNMEARARNKAESKILAAAQLHEYNKTGSAPTISTIQDAKTYFNVR